MDSTSFAWIHCSVRHVANSNGALWNFLELLPFLLCSGWDLWNVALTIFSKQLPQAHKARGLSENKQSLPSFYIITDLGPLRVGAVDAGCPVHLQDQSPRHTCYRESTSPLQNYIPYGHTPILASKECNQGPSPLLQLGMFMMDESSSGAPLGMT